MKIIDSLPIRCSYVSYTVPLSPDNIFCGCQRRTVFSLVTKLTSQMKVINSRNKTEVKQLPVCQKPTMISFNNKPKSPLFREPLVKSSTDHPMHVLTHEKLMRHKTSSNVFYQDLIKNRNLDVTSPYGSSRCFKQSIHPSSGLKLLIKSSSHDFIIKNIFQKGYVIVQKNISSTLSSDLALKLSIFIGFIMTESICPEQILNEPSILLSDMFPIVKEYLRDTYVNKICILHKTPSPCECGEFHNIIIKDRFPPVTTLDWNPMGLDDNSTHSKLKKVTCIVGAFILVAIVINK